MNISIILICVAGIIMGLDLIFAPRKSKGRPKWVIRAHSLAGLLSIIWAGLTIVEEVWAASLGANIISLMKQYDSIIFGLCWGVLLTLWLSGQLILRSDDNAGTE